MRKKWLDPFESETDTKILFSTVDKIIVKHIRYHLLSEALSLLFDKMNSRDGSARFYACKVSSKR